MGLKHSGKTTYASMYAEREGVTFADADYLVMKMIKPLSVRDYYRSHGKEAFQLLETDAVDDFLLAHDEGFVLSLGGGASDNTALLERIREEGKLVYLYRKEEDLLPVIMKDGIPPFLDPGNVEGSFHELFLRRDRIYRDNADLIVDMGEYGNLESSYLRLADAMKEAFS